MDRNGTSYRAFHATLESDHAEPVPAGPRRHAPAEVMRLMVAPRQGSDVGTCLAWAGLRGGNDMAR
jgi:hypothetical protein